MRPCGLVRSCHNVIATPLFVHGHYLNKHSKHIKTSNVKLNQSINITYLMELYTIFTIIVSPTIRPSVQPEKQNEQLLKTAPSPANRLSVLTKDKWPRHSPVATVLPQVQVRRQQVTSHGKFYAAILTKILHASRTFIFQEQFAHLQPVMLYISPNCI